MTCQPGELRLGISAEAKALKWMGLGYLYPVRLLQRITCPECRVELTAGSTAVHLRHMQRTEPAIDWIWMPVDHMEHQPQMYDMSFLRLAKRCL